jgi:hypothetical protein
MRDISGSTCCWAPTDAVSEQDLKQAFGDAYDLNQPDISSSSTQLWSLRNAQASNIRRSCTIESLAPQAAEPSHSQSGVTDSFPKDNYA